MKIKNKKRGKKNGTQELLSGTSKHPMPWAPLNQPNVMMLTCTSYTMGCPPVRGEHTKHTKTSTNKFDMEKSQSTHAKQIPKSSADSNIDMMDLVWS